jgi:hypothetical protein
LKECLDHHYATQAANKALPGLNTIAGLFYCVSSNVEAVIEVEPSAFVHTIADSEPEMDEEDLDMLHATQVLL